MLLVGSVAPQHIVNAVRLSVFATGLQDYNMALRASGSMAPKLTGQADSIIMKLGPMDHKYLSYTFIHSQIGALTAGVAPAMATPLQFHMAAHI